MSHRRGTGGYGIRLLFSALATLVIFAGLGTVLASTSLGVNDSGAISRAIAQTNLATTNTEPLPSASLIAKLPRFNRPETPPRPPAPPSFLNWQQLEGAYVPPQESAPADPTNFGDRVSIDAYGRPISNAPLIVLHETVGTASSAINTFRAYTPRDEDQRSYHALIRRNGTIVYIVPPEYRAFGAGNSMFNGHNGPEAVATNPLFPPSVNNFAYHISLETPDDGRGNQARHSGYTDAQYRSLAWLVLRTSISFDRITTHRDVDRSGSRRDPRSFDPQRFARSLQEFAA